MLQMVIVGSKKRMSKRATAELSFVRAIHQQLLNTPGNILQVDDALILDPPTTIENGVRSTHDDSGIVGVVDRTKSGFEFTCKEFIKSLPPINRLQVISHAIIG